MKYIGNLLQIAAGVFLGMSTLHLVEYHLAKYQIEIAMRELKSVEMPRIEFPKAPETRIETVAPKDKEMCLSISDGIYNEMYLTCREGKKITIRHDLNTGQEWVIKVEPILKNVNVTSGR